MASRARIGPTLAALTLVVAACSGSDTTDRSAPTPTRPVTLAEYLTTVLTLKLESFEISADQPDTVSAMAAYNWSVANQYRRAADVLAELEPPPEATDHAVGYGDLAADGHRVFGAMAEAWLSRGSVEELQPAIGDIAARSAELGTELQDLITIALGRADTRMSRYLLEAAALRSAFGESYSDAIDALEPTLGAEDGADLAATLESGAATFLAFLGPWDALQPPPRAEEPHDLQRELFATIAEIFFDLVEPAAASDTLGMQPVVERMAAFNVDLTTSSVAWNRLLIEALAG